MIFVYKKILVKSLWFSHTSNNYSRLLISNINICLGISLIYMVYTF